MTTEEIIDLGKAISEDILYELDSYGLYFDLEEPNIAIVEYNNDDDWELYIEIVGHELPDDIIKSEDDEHSPDERVFGRMLNDIANNHMISNKCEIDEVYCYIYAHPSKLALAVDNNPIFSDVYVENISIGFFVHINGPEF